MSRDPTDLAGLAVWLQEDGSAVARLGPDLKVPGVPVMAGSSSNLFNTMVVVYFYLLYVVFICCSFLTSTMGTRQLHGLRPRRKTSHLPSAAHYVGYVEDDETPEMIMKKFEEFEKVRTRLAHVKASGTFNMFPADIYFVVSMLTIHSSAMNH